MVNSETHQFFAEREVCCILKPFQLSAIEAAIREAQSVGTKPTLISVKTIIGYGMPTAGTRKAHSDAPGEEAFVTARAVDSQQRVFDLPVESVGPAKNLSWLDQVTVRLPPELSGAGDLSVTITVRGVESNAVTLRVN